MLTENVLQRVNWLKIERGDPSSETQMSSWLNTKEKKPSEVS